jgi:hypothetical protein
MPGVPHIQWQGQGRRAEAVQIWTIRRQPCQLQVRRGPFRVQASTIDQAPTELGSVFRADHACTSARRGAAVRASRCPPATDAPRRHAAHPRQGLRDHIKHVVVPPLWPPRDLERQHNSWLSSFPPLVGEAQPTTAGAAGCESVRAVFRRVRLGEAASGGRAALSAFASSSQMARSGGRSAAAAGGRCEPVRANDDQGRGTSRASKAPADSSQRGASWQSAPRRAHAGV